METFYNTRQVAKFLKVSVTLLNQAVWSGRVQAPQKSPSGNFLWTVEDINRACWVLHQRAFVNSVLAGAAGVQT